MTSIRKPRGDDRSGKTSDHDVNFPSPGIPRHRAIYEELLAEIQSGVYKPGDRLPSEALLCERFDASRITVAKAVQGLQRDHLVTRRPGSGTYVESPTRPNSLQFGLLIPDLGSTEIFAQICQGIVSSPAAKLHSLTWGHSTADQGDPVRAMEELCQQYMTQRVAGVFFAPLEHVKGKDEANRRIVGMLERAGIPIVLLDRCFEAYPDRSNFDLVGIDNHRAGYVLTRHLIQTGAMRIVFAMRENSASTVEARAAGYREALFALRDGAQGTIVKGDFEDLHFVEEMLGRSKPDAIVCANDVTAARLMQTLVSLGVRIPGDIKMAGVDDVRYAKFLPTPLTSVRQDCIQMGAVAMATMLKRVETPDLPVKDVLVRFELIVRASSGATSAEDETGE
jgi:GntR family transcriptional regulator, arabinose operon transcriptional repressor